MFDGWINSYIYMPYPLFVLLVGLAFLAVEHVLADLVTGIKKLMEWRERRRQRKEATPATPATPAILTLEDYRREKYRN